MYKQIGARGFFMHKLSDSHLLMLYEKTAINYQLSYSIRNALFMEDLEGIVDII